MLTDRPSSPTDGVRIAASRAGQRDGDDADAAPPTRPVPVVPPPPQARPTRPLPDPTSWRPAPKPGQAGASPEPEPEPEDDRRSDPTVAPPVLAERFKRVSPPVADAAGAGGGAKPPRPDKPTAPPGRRPARPRALVLRRRRLRRRIFIGFTVFLSVSTLLAGVAALYVQHKLGQIKRVTLPALSGDSRGQVMNVLLVGSDSRDNLQGEAAAQAGKGQVSGQRSDTIMILHIDPRQQKAAIVSVPRDLYVPIAGTNYSDRVNTAFAVGGPDKLVATVQQALAVTINHYVEVDFVGFKDIVDTVGGVTEYVPYPARDAFSGLDLAKAGCIELDGTQGLAWVRSRSIEFLVNGKWDEDPRADLGRIERQQDFIRRMMKKAVSTGLTNPLQLNRLIDIGVKDVTLDGTLSSKDITTLGRRFSSLDPDKVALATLPTTPADIGGASVLKLQATEAQPLIDLVNGKAPQATTAAPAPGAASPAPTAAATVGPADVRVQVLNGVGTAGAAAKAATGLTALGFPIADKGDAPAPSAKTTIRYASGQVVKAQLLQKAIQGPSVLQEDATMKAVDVSLVLGSDYTGLKAGPITPVSAPAAAATTTSSLPRLNPVPLPKGTTAPPC